MQLTSYAGTVSRARAREWTDEALARELGLDREAVSADRHRAADPNPPSRHRRPTRVARSTVTRPA